MSSSPIMRGTNVYCLALSSPANARSCSMSQIDLRSKSEKQRLKRPFLAHLSRYLELASGSGHGCEGFRSN